MGRQFVFFFLVTQNLVTKNWENNFITIIIVIGSWIENCEFHLINWKLINTLSTAIASVFMYLSNSQVRK